jgi:hypothetical protein
MSDEKAQENGKVRIRFRGLCPFVPGADLDRKERQPDWVGAFLVNATAATKEEFPGIPAELPDHFPFLEFRTKDLKGLENAPEQTVLLPLKNLDIVFVPPSAGALQVDLANGVELGEIPTSAQESNFFDWVTPMDGVTLGSGKVADECFEDDPSRRLVARVHITQGVLQTGSFGLIGKNAAVAPLMINGEPKRRAAAKSVTLLIDCPGEFKIRMQTFGEPEAKVQELVFRQPPSGEILPIGISNLCAEDFLSDGSQDLAASNATRPDDDFRWNYVISANAEELVPEAGVPGPYEEVEFPPTLVVALTKNDGGGGVGVQCSPPKTAPASGDGLFAMQAVVGRLSQ